MKKAIILTITVFLVLVLSAVAVSAQTCAISKGIGHPLLSDFDCDKTPDVYDNCPFITNPWQRDAEGNGLGDACDLVIESIRTNPADFVYNGRAFNVFVTLYNNRDYNIRNMKVSVFLPGLRIEAVSYIDNLEPYTSQTVEFFLRAPICSPAYLASSPDHLIAVEANFMNLYSEEEIIPGITSIRIVPDNKCLGMLQTGQTMDNTFIDVMEIQDVYKGRETVFPIKISNREQVGKEYIFSVTGLDGWGSHRLEPGSLIIVPSESDRTMDLYISAYDNVPPGERVFVVSVKSGEEVQRFLLIANVKENESFNPGVGVLFSLKVVLVGGLIILIVIAVVIGLKKYIGTAKGNENKEIMYS